jgi:hypothetical protein
VPPLCATSAAICSSSVLLPMPGSPPTSTHDPGTMPPPSTRLNSTMRSARRDWPSCATLGSATGLLIVSTGAMLDRLFSGARTVTSASVFHSPHSGHLPAQRKWTAPHAEQIYCFLSLAAGMIASPCQNICACSIAASLRSNKRIFILVVSYPRA